MKGNLLKTLFFAFLVLTGWEAFGQCPYTEEVLKPAGNSWQISRRVTPIMLDFWGSKEYRGKDNDPKFNKESRVSKCIFAPNENVLSFSTGINLSLFEI